MKSRNQIRLERIQRRLRKMPDKYRTWNGIIFNEDIWIDKAMLLIKGKKHTNMQNPYSEVHENDSNSSSK